QELGKDNEVVEINGQQVLIDGFTYIHTLFRHFSEKIKGHQAGKSYHFDENIGFKEIPNFLQKAFNCFKNQPESIKFNYVNLFVNFNGEIYAIWLRRITKYVKGKEKKNYYRVQTFYPVENEIELQKVKKHLKIETNCGFSYLIENLI